MNPTEKTTGCTALTGEPVSVAIGRHCTHLSPRVIADVRTRLAQGEAKYGAVLRTGWDGAPQELYQELLDAIAYCVASPGIPDEYVDVLGELAMGLVDTEEEG